MTLPFRTLFSSVILLALSACSGTYNSYIDNLQLAFAETPDVELSLADVNNAKADLLYVKHGERAQAAMALMFIEAGQHKWVSADNAMLIMQKGRIVRTLGFGNDLLYLTNTGSDPINTPVSLSVASQWLRLADWRSGEYGYAMRSSFSQPTTQTLRYFDTDISVKMVTEQVQYETPSHFVRFDSNWHNYYWYDTQTGELLKSQQTLAPFWQPITMTYMSRIARRIALNEVPDAQK